MTSPRGKVVVIDDSPIVLDLMRRVLGGGGWEVLTCAHAFGEEASIREFAPHVILLDIGMQGVDETGLRERVMVFRALTRAPVILHSARDESELEKLVRTSMAQGWLVKSGESEHVLEAVERWRPA